MENNGMGAYDGEFLTLVRKSCKECKIELLVLVKGINMMGGII
jgi:hypothetical protein